MAKASRSLAPRVGVEGFDPGDAAEEVRSGRGRPGRRRAARWSVALSVSYSARGTFGRALTTMPVTVWRRPRPMTRVLAGVDAEALGAGDLGDRRDGRAQVRVAGEHEVVGVAGVGRADRRGEAGQAAVERERGEVRQRGRGRRALRQVRGREPAREPPVAGDATRSTGTALVHRPVSTCATLSGIAGGAEDPEDARRGHAREEVLEIEPDHDAAPDVRRRGCAPSARRRTRARPGGPGSKSRISCSTRRCSAFRRGFGRLEHPRRTGARAAAACSGSGAAARRRTTRSSPRTSANHSNAPTSSSRNAASSPTVSIRGTGQRANAHRGVKERLAQRRAAASRRAAAARRGRSRRRRQLARAVERRAVIGREDLQRDGPHPRAAAHGPARRGAPARRAPTRRRGTRRRARGRVRGARSLAATKPPDGSRRACRTRARNSSRAARDALL